MIGLLASLATFWFEITPRTSNSIVGGRLLIVFAVVVKHDRAAWVMGFMLFIGPVDLASLSSRNPQGVGYIHTHMDHTLSNRRSYQIRSSRCTEALKFQALSLVPRVACG